MKRRSFFALLAGGLAAVVAPFKAKAALPTYFAEDITTAQAFTPTWPVQIDHVRVVVGWSKLSPKMAFRTESPIERDEDDEVEYPQPEIV